MAHRVTLIPGDGTGPELSAALETVIAVSGVAIAWERHDAGAAVLAARGTPLPDEVVASVRDTGVAMKGPVTTPVGSGFRSVNVALRKELDLYAAVRPARSLPGVPSRFSGVDLVVVRENTEDLYAGVEREVSPGVAESIKVITRAASERVVRFACEWARAYGRHRVTAVHKANIMKLTDGLFLRTAREVAAAYPDLEFDDRIVDNLCLQLVQAPERFDVLVAPNLYGDIVSDLCAGLIGGPGIAPGANFGSDCAVFEAVHGSGPDIAGRDIVNPTAFLLSGALMLAHLGEEAAAARLSAAVAGVIAEGRCVTRDLGGSAGTREFTAAVADRLQAATVQ